MSETEPSREFDLFMCAIELEGDARARFLDEHCGEGTPLRTRLNVLLVAHDRATGAEAEDAPEPVSPALVPKDIGGYKIMRRLGEGGMGIVYAAEQTRPIRRRVAVKILKTGSDSSEVLARFDAERQALALMNHASVAQILDAGVHEGRPFFVMELIAGMPITEYCDRRCLPIRDRLELLLRVCDGVQHAHQRGIIHRDLKPSNILVAETDGVPIPKIIDFGIAKAVTSNLFDATIHTEIGRIIGTPDFMSPEQADTTVLDIDTRTDVYSLGALLYELLTGVTVFGLSDRRAGLDEIRQVILRQDPRRPSERLSRAQAVTERRAADRASNAVSLRSMLAHELDWVALRCLEKDRGRRYGSAAELSDDIQRYLDRKAVRARPPSTLYRVSKFAGRHAVVVAASLIVAVSLVSAAAVSIPSAFIANRERAAAEARADELARVAAFEAERLGAVVPRAFGETIRQLLISDVSDGAQDQLASLLDSVNFTTVATRVLDAHIFEDTLSAIDEQFDEDPAIRSALLQTTADTMVKLGLVEDALDPQLDALAVRRQLLGERHPSTVESVAQTAKLMVLLGRLTEAEPLFLEALKEPGQAGERSREAYLMTAGRFAFLLQELGRFDESERWYHLSLSGLRELHGDAHPTTSRMLNELGLMLFERGDHATGLDYLAEALAASRKILDPQDPSLLTGLTNYGGALIHQGRLEEGYAAFDEALKGFRAVLGDDHQTTLTLVSNMGYVLQELERFDEAEVYYQNSLDARRRILGPDHPDTLTSELNLANLYVERGTPADGAGLLRHVVETRSRTLGFGHPRTVNAASNALPLYRSIGELKEALALGERLIADALPQLPEGHRMIWSVHHQHARSLLAAQRFAPALESAMVAYDGRISTYGKDHPLVRSSANLVASIYEARHAAEPALGYNVDATLWRRRAQGDEPPNATGK